MKDRVTLFSPSDYKVMPWKNGAGSTTELRIAPEGASLQSGFDWRISLAQVPTSGPFSSFPNYQRTIMLLRGDPMRLVHQGQGEHLLEPFQPYDFHGAWQTEGILTGRPVEDFNVMVRDGFGKAHVDVQNGLENPIFPLQNGSLQFIYSCRGAITVQMQNQTYKLGEQHSILIEDSCNTTLHAESTSSTAIIVALKPTKLMKN
jgi:environmental stress-induced protein Ves